MSIKSLSPLYTRAAALLRQREGELRKTLDADEAGLAQAAGSVEVVDFKDLAAGEAAAAIEDVASAHAASELAQVVAALRRLDNGSYGFCLDCGDPIDERRLLALPSTPLCTSCQSAHERSQARSPVRASVS
jgi:DnaK suppressor protein